MSRMKELGKRLAYSAAVSDIEMLCPCTRSADFKPTYDVRPEYQSDGDREAVATAVEYLTLLGLLEPVAGSDELVRILPAEVSDE